MMPTEAEIEAAARAFHWAYWRRIYKAEEGTAAYVAQDTWEANAERMREYAKAALFAAERVKELEERCDGTRARAERAETRVTTLENDILQLHVPRAERAEAELVHTKNCHEETAEKLHGYIHAFAALTERNAKLVKLLKDIYDFGYDMTEHKRTKAILIECGMEIPE